MARPTSITNEQILEAARKVFTAHGQSASTAAIARAAGISEGSIFRRFRTKDALFIAAMGFPEPEFVDALAERVGEGDFAEQIEHVAHEMIAYFRDLIPCGVQLRAHPRFNPLEHLKDNPDTAPFRLLREVTRYFDQEMRLGRLRPCDPEVVARMFIGALHNYAFLEHIGVNHRMPFPAATYVRGLIDVLWSGVRPGVAPDEVSE